MRTKKNRRRSKQHLRQWPKVLAQNLVMTSKRRKTIDRNSINKILQFVRTTCLTHKFYSFSSRLIEKHVNEDTCCWYQNKIRRKTTMWYRSKKHRGMHEKYRLRLHRQLMKQTKYLFHVIWPRHVYFFSIHGDTRYYFQCFDLPLSMT